MLGFRTAILVACLALLNLSSAQKIWDVWQTTWDRAPLFQSQKRTSPLLFTTQSPSTVSNIVVDDTSLYQPILGFGGSLTDSSAQLLNDLKLKASEEYWSLLNYAFSPINGENAAGLSYLRVPLGATDFSPEVYSYDEFDNDLCLNDFDINYTPPYVFDVLHDILSINPALRVHLVPWSPPAWMKDSRSAFGGSVEALYIPIYAHYLFKSLQEFQKKGIQAYAISIQNEPMYESMVHPTAKFSPKTEAAVAKALRKLMVNKGWTKTKIIGFEHNWDQASKYPVELMQLAGDSFDGVAFHCASGTVDQQDAFHSAFPQKEIYFTECSGVHGSDWWGDVKWYMDNLFIGAIEHNAQVALMWNLALDGTGNPALPGASTCGGKGCRGIVTVNSNGTWGANQEFYAMAQVSKATIPRDEGGPNARRIGVNVQGTLRTALRVAAFVTPRTDSADPERFSLVVLNRDDFVDNKWNPQPVAATIEFRGKRVAYTFPVGITTLWWYAPNNENAVVRQYEMMAEDDLLVQSSAPDLQTHEARAELHIDTSGVPKDWKFTPQLGEEVGALSSSNYMCDLDQLWM